MARLASFAPLLYITAVVHPLAAQTAVEAGTFQVGSHQLPYEIRGTGPPLVLVPGWTQDLHTWDGLVDAFAPEYRVIRFSRGPFGLRVDPIDALALLDHLEIDSAILLGHSVGALAALRFTVSHPERVTGLVLYAPPSGTPGLGIPWRGVDSWSATLERLGIAEPPDAIARRHGIDSLLVLAAQQPSFAIPAQRPEARARLAELWASYAATGGVDWLAPPQLADATPPTTVADLARLDVPTLVLNGNEEIPYFRIAADILHYAIPGAERAVIPGGGHMLHLEQPAAFTAAVLQFARRLPPP